jgi:hypothetical protein
MLKTLAFSALCFALVHTNCIALPADSKTLASVAASKQIYGKGVRNQCLPYALGLAQVFHDRYNVQAVGIVYTWVVPGFPATIGRHIVVAYTTKEAGRLLGLTPKHCAGSPVLTPLSFAHIPPPLPRSSRKMLATLSSLPGFGLRLAPTISTGTLGFSRLARRSIFIVVCTLADSLNEPFPSRASMGRSLFRVASTASGWNVSCRAGYLPPTGFRRPFHGAPEPHPTRSFALTASRHRALQRDPNEIARSIGRPTL